MLPCFSPAIGMGPRVAAKAAQEVTVRDDRAESSLGLSDASASELSPDLCAGMSKTRRTSDR